MALKTLAKFTLVHHSIVPETKLVLGKRMHRNIEQRIYEAPCTNTSTAPSTPVNPDNLSPVGWQQASAWTWLRHWVCENMEIERAYGTPLSSVYRETWTYSNPWTQDDEES